MLSVSTQTLHAALFRSMYSLLTWSFLGTLQGILGAFAKFRTVTINFVTSEIRQSNKIWQDYQVLYKKTLVHLWVYLTQLFLNLEIFKKKNVYKIKKDILCSITFFSENRALCQIMWKNTAERGRPQMAIWRMRIACWILKATRTHSKYVILIAIPLQRRLHERASMLSHTCLCNCT